MDKAETLQEAIEEIGNTESEPEKASEDSNNIEGETINVETIEETTENGAKTTPTKKRRRRRIVDDARTS